MLVDINNNTYKVEDTEFNIIPHTEYNNLIIRNNEFNDHNSCLTFLFKTGLIYI